MIKTVWYLLYINNNKKKERKYMTEIWKDIEGFDSYQVSNIGRVKSFKRDKINGNILMQLLNKGGYWKFNLYSNSVMVTGRVHRLVAEAFIDNPLNKRTVNHINGIKTDNRVENLEWATYSENTLHAYDTGLNSRRLGVIQCTLDGEFIAEFESTHQASKLTGTQQSEVSRVANGIRKTANGYIFKFKDI